MFIDHTHPETACTAMTEHQSHTNPQEAVLTCLIVQHLLDQGYKGSNIVVLTPDLGHLLEIKHQMKLTGSANERVEHEDIDDLRSAGERVEEEHNDFFYGNDERRAVRISTIDNFQGEEADIVVLSLVRNNDKCSINFMKESERVNVMLSRALCGLITLGTKRYLESCDSVKGRILWTKFFQLMQCDGHAVLPGLPVQCKHHPETKRFLKNANDFDRAANGGCDLPCAVKLKCGHECPINSTLTMTMQAYCVLYNTSSTAHKATSWTTIVAMDRSREQRTLRQPERCNGKSKCDMNNSLRLLL
jgi:hypothetical protein